MTYAGYAAPGDCVTFPSAALTRTHLLLWQLQCHLKRLEATEALTKISGFERLSTEALYLSSR